jgi:hypothetical protein
MSDANEVQCCRGGNGPSLQEAFLAFKKKRNAQLKAVALAKSQAGSIPHDQLRARFLTHCRARLGVPYAKRYHEDPDDPLHGLPLYLDCCGLVRDAIEKMPELGFKLGTLVSFFY